MARVPPATQKRRIATQAGRALFFPHYFNADAYSSSDILRRLEDIVLSVMSQLADILSSSEEHNVNGRKIAVELVDRKKPLRSDGYVFSTFITPK